MPTSSKVTRIHPMSLQTYQSTARFWETYTHSEEGKLCWQHQRPSVLCGKESGNTKYLYTSRRFCPHYVNKFYLFYTSMKNVNSWWKQIYFGWAIPCICTDDCMLWTLGVGIISSTSLCFTVIYQSNEFTGFKSTSICRWEDILEGWLIC